MIRRTTKHRWRTSCCLKQMAREAIHFVNNNTRMPKNLGIHLLDCLAGEFPSVARYNKRNNKSIKGIAAKIDVPKNGCLYFNKISTCNGRLTHDCARLISPTRLFHHMKISVHRIRQRMQNRMSNITTAHC